MNLEVKWLYVPTKENPSDLGTRGEKLSSLWFNGPKWLKHKENWLTQPETVETPHASCESIGVKENIGMVTVIIGRPILEELWSKHRVK